MKENNFSFRKVYSIPFFLGLLILVFIQGCEKPIRVAAVATSGITDVSFTSCTISGQVIDLGEGAIQQHGFCYGTAENPTIEESSEDLGSISTFESFTYSITGLAANTTYYVRAYVQNTKGTYYGESVSFKTLQADKPSLSTTKVSANEANSAVSGGTIINDGGSTITAHGVCYSTSLDPTTDDPTVPGNNSEGTFSCTLTNLRSETTYYVKAYATNGNGTAYGENESFTTTVNYISDVDQNQYKTVTIGFQTWMAENLRTEHYKDGSSIPNGATAGAITPVSDPGYRFNYNNATIDVTYGRLYTWNAVDNTNGLCPEGWSVPTNQDWKILTDYLGKEEVAGGKLKETGTDLWDSPNNASNESGFSALPAGMRESSGTYLGRTTNAFFWTSSSFDASNASAKELSNDSEEVASILTSKSEGLSVRCIKD